MVQHICKSHPRLSECHLEILPNVGQGSQWVPLTWAGYALTPKPTLSVKHPSSEVIDVLRTSGRSDCHAIQSYHFETPWLSGMMSGRKHIGMYSLAWPRMQPSLSNIHTQHKDVYLSINFPSSWFRILKQMFTTQLWERAMPEDQFCKKHH